MGNICGSKMQEPLIVDVQTESRDGLAEIPDHRSSGVIQAPSGDVAPNTLDDEGRSLAHMSIDPAHSIQPDTDYSSYLQSHMYSNNSSLQQPVPLNSANTINSSFTSPTDTLSDASSSAAALNNYRDSELQTLKSLAGLYDGLFDTSQ